MQPAWRSRAPPSHRVKPFGQNRARSGARTRGPLWRAAQVEVQRPHERAVAPGRVGAWVGGGVIMFKWGVGDECACMGVVGAWMIAKQIAFVCVWGAIFAGWPLSSGSPTKGAGETPLTDKHSYKNTCPCRPPRAPVREGRDDEAPAVAQVLVAVPQRRVEHAHHDRPAGHVPAVAVFVVALM